MARSQADREEERSMITTRTTAMRVGVTSAAAALSLALAAPALADPPADWRRDGVVVSDVADTPSVRPDDRAVRTGPPTEATDPDLVTASASSDQGVFDWSDVFVALAVGALAIVAAGTLRSNGGLRKA
jgi:hypothetical protein